jgi:acyl CoA:acetate/3-ketoacid CoA transferase beta subunit
MSLTRAQILGRLAQELAEARSIGLVGIEGSELGPWLASSSDARGWPADGAPPVPAVVVLAARQVSEAGDVLLAAAPSAPALAQMRARLAEVPRVLAVVLSPATAERPALVPAESWDGSASSEPDEAVLLRRAAHRVLTEHGVLDVIPEGLLIRELAPGLSARRLQEQTAPTLHIAPDVAELALTVLDQGHHGVA